MPPPPLPPPPASALPPFPPLELVTAPELDPAAFPELDPLELPAFPELDPLELPEEPEPELLELEPLLGETPPDPPLPPMLPPLEPLTPLEEDDDEEATPLDDPAAPDDDPELFPPPGSPAGVCEGVAELQPEPEAAMYATNGATNVMASFIDILLRSRIPCGILYHARLSLSMYRRITSVPTNCRCHESTRPLTACSRRKSQRKAHLDRIPASPSIATQHPCDAHATAKPSGELPHLRSEAR